MDYSGQKPTVLNPDRLQNAPPVAERPPGIANPTSESGRSVRDLGKLAPKKGAPHEPPTCAHKMGDAQPDGTAGFAPNSNLEWSVAAYHPFPCAALPEPLRSYVRQTATAIGCDDANVALPVLAVCAAGIGNTRQIRLKRGWTEPAIVWAAIVGYSGSRKSPPFRAAIKPLTDAESVFRDDYARELAQYNALSGEQRENRSAPVLRRVLVEDVTIESVGTILAENPRGIINANDEIDDWFQSMCRYKGRNGGTDRARWLKLSNAQTLTVDRKTGDPHVRKLFIPMASCSLAGTVQPRILASSLDQMARASGLAARLLLAMPPQRTIYWSEDEVDPKTEEDYSFAVRGLLALTMTADARGRHRPHVLDLASDAKRAWVQFFNSIQDAKANAESDFGAVLAKLEGYAARFALIHHVVTEVVAGRDALSPVPEVSVRAGIDLAEWFTGEARRIYATLGESDEQRAERELLEWIEGRGGRCTPRELQRARGSSFPTSEAAESALEALVSSGRGNWIRCVIPSGGRPTKVFALRAHTGTDNTDTTLRAEGGPADSVADNRPTTTEKPREKPDCVGIVERRDAELVDPRSKADPRLNRPSVGRAAPPRYRSGDLFDVTGRLPD